MAVSQQGCPCTCHVSRKADCLPSDSTSWLMHSGETGPYAVCTVDKLDDPARPTPIDRARAQARLKRLTRTVIVLAGGATAFIGVTVAKEHPGASAAPANPPLPGSTPATTPTTTPPPTTTTTPTTSPTTTVGPISPQGSPTTTTSPPTTTTTSPPTTTTTRPVTTSGGTSRQGP